MGASGEASVCDSGFRPGQRRPGYRGNRRLGGDLDRPVIQRAISEIRASQQPVQRRFRRERAVERGRVAPFHHLREENDLDAALLRQLLQRGGQRLRRDRDVRRIRQQGNEHPDRDCPEPLHL